MSDSKHLGTKELQRQNSRRGSSRLSSKEKEMQRQASFNLGAGNERELQRQNSKRGSFNNGHHDKDHHSYRGDHRHRHHGEEKPENTEITEAEGLRRNLNVQNR